MFFSSKRLPDSTNKNSRFYARGVTLLELMIVVAIVGIIASVAYPSYTRYIERAQITDGTGGLTEAAQRMERCFTANMTYAGCNIPANSPEGFYSITVTSADNNSFLLTATRQAGRVIPGNCNSLTINQRGQQTPANDCW